MEVKSPSTYEQQLKKMQDRGIVIKDRDFCISALQRLNYYRLTAYMLPFKIDENSYSGESFERIYSIYEFDRQLRALLISALEEIELLFRTVIAYNISHKYGSLGYLDSDNFNKKHNHKKFSAEFSEVVERSKDSLFVEHHLKKYDGKFPLWVAVELFSFGMLSRFFADLPLEDQKQIAGKLGSVSAFHISSWLYCLSILRNKCAHYMRLYFTVLPISPKDTKTITFPKQNKIYSYLRVMKELYPNTEKWNFGVLANLHALIERYREFIDLKHIGFPNNWSRELTK